MDLLHRFIGALGLREFAPAAIFMGGTIAALYVQRHPHGMCLAFFGPPLGVLERHLNVPVPVLILWGESDGWAAGRTGAFASSANVTSRKLAPPRRHD